MASSTTSTYRRSIIFPILLLLPSLIILEINLCTANPPAGFVSIDCGSSETGNYTDALGLEWAPDATIWPDISSWSFTSAITPPTGDTTGGAKYKTLRYFPPASKSTLNPTKFCYSLPAMGDVYYLVRATFWYGTSVTTTLYSTRVSGIISFRVVVDTFTGAQITITLPQTSPQTEEMYVRAQSGSSSVTVCFSAASDSSDSPFVNALELRPLSSEMLFVSVMNTTNAALRTASRVDFGASASAPRIVRYPDDSLDRLWVTDTTEPIIQTSLPVDVDRMNDSPPVSVLQTSFVASTNAGFYYNLTRNLAGTSYQYYVAFYFAELDSRVNVSGLRVFDMSINGRPVFLNLDVYKQVGLYRGYEIYSPKPQGPYSDYILINATSPPTSIYTPFIAAAEILQVLDNPMVPATYPVDILAVQGITTALSKNLSRFTGDPCFPVEYKYPWLNCTGKDILPTRVISISLSNWNLVGNIPTSINNLDQVVQISLDGNALEGAIPVDLSNMKNLESLNLSYNKLSGGIPDSLGKLPKLTYLDLRYNNLSGEIPLILQQKAENGQLIFKYAEGNNIQTNQTNTSPPPKQSRLPLIIGVVAGVVVLCVAILCIVIVCRRRKSHAIPISNNEVALQNKQNPSPNHFNQAYQSHAIATSISEPYANVVSHTRVVEAANAARRFTFGEIQRITNNFLEEIGRGGFGIVYKGQLGDGKFVAVKVSSHASQQGSDQFLNEVAVLSRVHHKNLVRLLGYCTEERLVLVYEFMPNGSLFDRLFISKKQKGNTALAPTSTPLTWIQRLQILLDAARGLAYLHHSCDPKIIHMDVKSSNILLTENLEGKVSDFGISRPNFSDGGIQMATQLVGTLGYMDPELASTSILSEKVDIYSFGVVLFEALCGKPPLTRDRGGSNNKIPIVDWARPYYEKGAIEEIVDHKIGSNYNASSIWKVAEIAMACAELKGRKRPTMNEVCNELAEALRLEISSNTISPTPTGEYFPLIDVNAR